MKKKRKTKGYKKIVYVYGAIIVALLIICISIYISYSKKLKQATEQSLLATEKLEAKVPENLYQEASAELSKSIQEAIKESQDEFKKIQEEQKEEVLTTNAEENSISETETTPEPIPEPVPEPVKPIAFIIPIEGEILKEYAAENLIFSETLQEWITHNGIDIKAPRTTIVKAAEDGTIIGIKKDPRYGLTIIIEHRDGYKTIYSNLLTTELVKEGEVVSKGQSIGTVGNSAIFEIADEPHLHFELLKNEEHVDPKMYIK